SGEEEARSFEDKEFVKLHQSTLRKVDILHSIVEDDLLTDSELKEIYGLTPQGIYELVKENWGSL
ncbi:hypothetical protein BWZ43_24955, partial [Heyndrickxia oleronia]